MHGFLIALASTFVESAVRWVEDRFASAPGPSKRAAAMKYVKDRLHAIQRLMGPFGVLIDDSVIFGLIDAAVSSLHLSGEFAPHKTETRQYNYAPTSSAFEWTDPATQIKSWKRTNPTTGVLESVRLMEDPQAPGRFIPEPDRPEDVSIVTTKPAGAISDGLLNVLNRGV